LHVVHVVEMADVAEMGGSPLRPILILSSDS
jgi:hypothetical protein